MLLSHKRINKIWSLLIFSRSSQNENMIQRSCFLPCICIFRLDQIRLDQIRLNPSCLVKMNNQTISVCVCVCVCVCACASLPGSKVSYMLAKCCTTVPQSFFSVFILRQAPTKFPHWLCTHSVIQTGFELGTLLTVPPEQLEIEARSGLISAF